ncbi:TolB family protein [Bacteroidota bacterium]
MKICCIALSVFFLSMISCNQNEQKTDDFPELSGPYLGQSLPGSGPEVFAPGIIGTGMFTRDIAISPDGKELFYSVAIGNYTYSTILYTKQINGKWSTPEVAPFAASAKTMDLEPAFNPAGNRLYFISSRPVDGNETGGQDIWYVERIADGWSDPVHPGTPLNTDAGEFFPSFTNDGYLYFTREAAGDPLNGIYRSKITDNTFTEPERLPEQVNCGSTRFNAFVSRDHSYIIVPAADMKDAYDQVDYYIVFRDKNDQWSQPLNMSEQINKDNSRGWSPFVSPDGNYFFFMSNKSEDIPVSDFSYKKLVELYNDPMNGNATMYWMKADFIEELREKAVF